MKKTYLVVYEKSRKNYSGFAPDIGGCGGLGDTIEEVRADLQAGIELYMEACLDLGHPIPEPAANSVTLPIEGETDPRVTYVVERLTVNVPRPRASKTNLAVTKPSPPKRRTLKAA